MIVNNKFTRAYNVLRAAKIKKRERERKGEVNVLEKEQYEIIGTE